MQSSEWNALLEDTYISAYTYAYVYTYMYI